MGKLIDRNRARRAREAREERAERILEAANVAFTKLHYSEVSLDAIGRQAGVKQGQTSLAFRSREELYMAVVRPKLTEWYDNLEHRLANGEDPMTTSEAADLVAKSLVERPVLTRLLGSLITALELHEDGMKVHGFLHWQRQRLLELASSLARRVDGADRWSAFDALFRAQLMAAAVHPLCRPVGNLAVDLVADDHQVFALDLEDEVHRVVRSTLSAD